MLRRTAARLRVPPSHCILVEDTLEHQKAARRIGMRTVWMQRWVRAAVAAGRMAPKRLAGRPAYVDRRIARLRELRNLRALR
jgi:putative hydrolase of the HAD superfamily